MQPLHCDIALVGGGLANALIALALHRDRPELDVCVIDAGPVGGNHIWSFFDSDVAAEHLWLVDPLIAHRWTGYDIAFPAHRRHFREPYNSITSDRVRAAVAHALPADRIISAVAVDVSRDAVLLDTQQRVTARHVIDGRGPGDLSNFDGGWQKFVGQALTVRGGHGLKRPIVMDATVQQIDGYRFVYCLPFDAETVFVEDTYYSDTPDLDIDAVAARIATYAAAREWSVARIDRQESGVLPVVSGGNFTAYWQSTGGDVAKSGLRAGMFHATTGYSLPSAVRLAADFAALLDAPDLPKALHDRAAQQWRDHSFYRMLDTLLFRAAAPEQRYKVLERFYRLSPALIGRFYAGGTTALDKLRILSGVPPVPLGKAIKALKDNDWR